MVQNVIIPSDFSGCHFYRMGTPMWAVRAVARNINFVETNRFVIHAPWYQGVSHVALQRMVSDQHLKLFQEFLKPLSQALGFWLSVNIDDVIMPDSIPKYNAAWKTYQVPSFAENITKMLNASDFIVTTTDELKKFYHEKCGVPNENFIVIPNYLPRWWAPNFNVAEIMDNFHKHKRRPRVAFTSSMLHFDMNNQNDGIDDFTHIIDFIRATVDKYEWCFIGAMPNQLKDLLKDKKITMYQGSDILNFIRELNDKHFQVVVAPLQDNVFNRCKSAIKLEECWALGIPVIAQDIITYNKLTDLVFKDSNDLQNKLDYVLQSPAKYKEIVNKYRHTVDFGDENFKQGCWLEKNLSQWVKLFSMQQRTLNIDLEKYNQGPIKQINADELEIEK
jgi:hypothetical protein